MAQQVLALAPSGDKSPQAAPASQCQGDKSLRAVVAAGVAVAGDSPAAETVTEEGDSHTGGPVNLSHNPS